MSKDEKKEEGQPSPIRAGLAAAAEDAATGATSLVAGLMAGTVAGPLAGLAAAVAMKGVIGAVKTAVAARSAKRADVFTEELIRSFPAQSPEELAQRIAEDDSFGEAIFQGYRRAVDSVDPIVLPALARLTAEYAKKGKRPDAVFRSLGHLLQDLGPEEFEELRVLMGVVMVFGKGARVHVMLVANSDGKGFKYYVSGAPVARNAQAEVAASPIARRLLALISHHGLADFDEGADLALTSQAVIDPAFYELAWSALYEGGGRRAD